MKRVLLLGAGHAHLVVLRALRRGPLPEARVTLVTPSARQVYSGMLPGLVAGHYAREEIEVDLAPLAAQAGVELQIAEVNSIPAGYDLVSLNVGSRPETPPYALAVKPFDVFIEKALTPGKARVAVAGGGAGGVELAMALRHRGSTVTLYSEKPEFGPALGRRIGAALARAGVILRGKTVFTEADRGAFDLVLWTTGAAPLPWLKTSGLALDARGFVLVDSTLRSVSHPHVFAAGDCATLRDAPHPKSGVYSVRHGAVLAKNVFSFLQERRFINYQPQKRSLSIITCGGKYAIAERGGWTAEGAWVWRWKNWIDRRWMASLM